MEQFDVLVVGSGGAGMRAALEVGRRKGLKVALITKIFPTRSATAMAQGGVNACLNNVAAEDTVETHTFDTVKGSDYLGDQDAIEFFCSRCPEGVLEMDHMGAPFVPSKVGASAGKGAMVRARTMRRKVVASSLASSVRVACTLTSPQFQPMRARL